MKEYRTLASAMLSVKNMCPAQEVTGIAGTGSRQTAWFGLDEHGDKIILLLCPRGRGPGNRRWSTAGVFGGYGRDGRPLRAYVRRFESNRSAWPSQCNGSYVPGSGDPWSPEEEQRLIDLLTKRGP
jgi:hypothetical protein